MIRSRWAVIVLAEGYAWEPFYSLDERHPRDGPGCNGNNDGGPFGRQRGRSTDNQHNGYGSSQSVWTLFDDDGDDDTDSTAKQRDTANLCPKCKFDRFVDVETQAGKVRRDCGRCGAFIEFVRW